MATRIRANETEVLFFPFNAEEDSEGQPDRLYDSEDWSAAQPRVAPRQAGGGSRGVRAQLRPRDVEDARAMFESIIFVVLQRWNAISQAI